MKIRFPKTSLLLKVVVVRMALGFLAGLCFLFALSASWLWACEVWMRPDIMLHWDERWIAAAAVAGFAAGFALLLKPARAARSFIAMVMAAFCGLAFIGVCFTAQALAIQGLMRHRDVALQDNELLDLASLFQNGEKFPAKCLKGYIFRNRHKDEPLDHLLEASRWRVRKAFLQKIITDEKHVALVTGNWPRLFPAVIGQDVTMARRHEMMRWLDTLARNGSTASDIREAAAFWMGLIVLTDSVEFAADRVHVRDMMLASADPPMSLTGDVWMRVLNSLFASDDPEKIANSSSRLASNRILLRRAVREGVRGMENQTDAVIHEIEKLDAAGESKAAAALWLDLRLLIERAGGNSAHGETRHWLCETLVKWLTEDSESVRKRFSDSVSMDRSYLATPKDFVIEMPEQMRARLTAHAMHLLERVPAQPEFNKRRSSAYVAPLELEHALMIRNFIDAGNRKMVSGRITSIMIDHTKFVKNHKETIDRPVYSMNEMALILLAVLEDLDGQFHDQITQALLFEEEVLSKDFRNFHRMLVPTYHLWRTVDGKSPSPRLSGAGRLAILALYGWPREYVKWFWWGKVTVMEMASFTRGEVNEFVDSLLKANRSGEKTFQLGRSPEGVSFDTARMSELFKLSSKSINYNDDQVRDLIRFSLIRRGILSYEHLPSGWPESFDAEPGIQPVNWYFPDESNWALLINSLSRMQTMLEHPEVLDTHVSRGLMEYLERNPPSAEIRAAILHHFDSQLSSGIRSQRLAAYRVLLKLSHWMGPEKRTAFRSRLHGLFNRDRPTLKEWADTMMLPMDPKSDYPKYDAISDVECRSEWVKWEDDELSAQLSWSSQIHQELAMLPHEWRLSPDRGVFMYLNTYLDACFTNGFTGSWFQPAGLDVALSGRYRRGLPPDVPFEATPWQRARELHLRKPGLDFPDRALFRPNMRQR